MRGLTTVILLASTVSLAGCVQSRLHLSDDYGRAVRQDIAAQVDDPDAKYLGVPPGGAHGARVSGAQDRYISGKVIEPKAPSTSSTAAGGGGGI